MIFSELQFTLVLVPVKTLSPLLVQLTFCVNCLQEELQATHVLSSMMKLNHSVLVFMVKLVVNNLVLDLQFLRMIFLALFLF